MAQAIFNSLEEKGNFTALSAGLSADGVSEISPNARAVLKENGIEFSHTSTAVSRELLSQADYIFGITERHAATLISMYPEFADRIYAMPEDVPDPFGGDMDIYRECFRKLQNQVKDICEYLINLDENTNVSNHENQQS